MHFNKLGLRVLGIAESFAQLDKYSTLAGVVMRGDMVIDGICLSKNLVGGNNSTSSILRLYRALARNDINILMLSGCIISYYNIVDIDLLASKADRPVICLTYKESEGIEDTIRFKFPLDKKKIELYRKLGGRKKIALRTGKNVLVRLSRISEKDALRILNQFTLQGSIPEPVRVAKLIAKSVRRYYPKDAMD